MLSRTSVAIAEGAEFYHSVGGKNNNELNSSKNKPVILIEAQDTFFDVEGKVEPAGLYPFEWMIAKVGEVGKINAVVGTF